MNVTLKDGIYWLKEPKIINLYEWAVNKNNPCVLILNEYRSDDFVTLVAYSSNKEYDYVLGREARSSNGKYVYMFTDYSSESCNPVGWV